MYLLCFPTDRQYPVLIQATAGTTSDDNVKYTITWEHSVDPGTPPPPSFIVSICDSDNKCVTPTIRKNSRKAECTLSYSTIYTINVTALFKLELDQTVSRSKTKTLVSLTLEPGKVTNLEAAQLECRHVIAVSWERPKSPRGRIREYDVTVKLGEDLIFQ